MEPFRSISQDQEFKKMLIPDNAQDINLIKFKATTLVITQPLNILFYYITGT